jgi:hypothetical protein
MKVKDFNVIKRYATSVIIKEDDFFNVAGYFWTNLTEKQVGQMLDLMDEQGEKPNADGWYQLRNGLRIKRV